MSRGPAVNQQLIKGAARHCQPQQLALTSVSQSATTTRQLVCVLAGLFCCLKVSGGQPLVAALFASLFARASHVTVWYVVLS